MTDRTLPRNTACALLCAGVVMLAGCNKAADSQAANPAAAGTAPAAPAAAGTSASAQQPAPYTPPTADQLYQMVAPIALFPDKLLAQVLAGSTYPDQITAADTMLQQHRNLTGTLLVDAVNPEPWDPSVKGLTQFPSVLDQMAQNIQWTTSLGEAYVNDPADVMNAIQVMRQRAQRNGSLRSSAQMQVVSQPADSTVDETPVESGDAPPTYAGPAVVPPPAQTIVIQPANPDTVYVPQYDPETVYGAPVTAYPGYTYVQPAGYSTGQMVTAGAIGFGVGVVVAMLFDHHHHDGGPRPGWGWNSWGMRWGGGPPPGGPGGYGGGWQPPAVVHNNTVYVSRSTTVVNRYVTNNINNSRTINNINSNNRTVNNIANNNQVYNNGNNRYINNATNNRTFTRNTINEQAPAQGPARQAMTMPHFGTPVRGAEPARFEQPRTAAQPAARPAEREAPRGIGRPQQQPRPEAAAMHEMPRTEPIRAVAPRPAEHAQERPAERPAAQPMEHTPPRPETRQEPQRAAPHMETPPEPQRSASRMEMRPEPQRPQPRPETRAEPQRPAAHPEPAHHEAPRPAPKKHDDNKH